MITNSVGRGIEIMLKLHRWIFLAQMLASVDFPYPLPVGDISHLIKSETERKSVKQQFSV